MSDDSFPVGTFARVDTCAGASLHTRSGELGRVVDSNGRTVRTVRFPDGTADSFHVDHLHRVLYLSVRFYGPGMQPGASPFHGSRFVVTGTRGNRRQMTVPADHARMGWNGDANGADAAVTFARVREDMCAPVAVLVRHRGNVRTYAVTEYGTCTCDDQYGPCEYHGETLVMREGAAVRTADDLAAEFTADAVRVTGEYPTPDFRSEIETIENALADNDSHGARWLPDVDAPDAADGYTLADMLADMVTTAESHLAAHGLSVWWEDGYRIVRVTGGPLA